MKLRRRCRKGKLSWSLDGSRWITGIAGPPNRRRHCGSGLGRCTGQSRTIGPIARCLFPHASAETSHAAVGFVRKCAHLVVRRLRCARGAADLQSSAEKLRLGRVTRIKGIRAAILPMNSRTESSASTILEFSFMIVIFVFPCGRNESSHPGGRERHAHAGAYE